MRCTLLGSFTLIALGWMAGCASSSGASLRLVPRRMEPSDSFLRTRHQFASKTRSFRGFFWFLINRKARQAKGFSCRTS